MLLDFVTVDVFTKVRFGGNPLAVILDARGLDDEAMQRIAAEFNLAETAFVLPPKNPANAALVRIFTPRAEMPFAGHPNVGTAFVLARRGEVFGRAIAGERLSLENKAGLVPIVVNRRDSAVAETMLRSPAALKLGDEVEAARLARAVSLPVEAIETSRHAPLHASCGAPFVIAEVRDRAALTAARPIEAAFAADFPREQVTGIHLYVRGSEAELDVQTRMFAPLHGIPEDPATGSANVALIGLLAHLEPAPDITLEKTVGQGFDLGRPSYLKARAVKAGGVVVETHVGGASVPVMSGTIDLG